MTKSLSREFGNCKIKDFKHNFVNSTFEFVNGKKVATSLTETRILNASLHT
jgi:hypothetical protein